MIESIISDDEVQDEIGELSSKMMENISNRFRLTLDLSENRKSFSEFDKRLNLDLLIDKLVANIQNVKIKLLEIM